MLANADGRVRSLVDRTVPFGERAAARAHRESDRHPGKIVLKIGD